MGNKSSNSPKTEISHSQHSNSAFEEYEIYAYPVDPLYLLEDTNKPLKIKLNKPPRVQNATLSANCYNTNGRKRCTALIINNADTQSRKGADVDVKNLSNLLKTMKSVVKIKNNLKKKEMIQCIQSFADNPKLGDYDICFIALLGITKTDTENKLTAISGFDSEFVSLAEIIDSFSDDRCLALRGKPKIFLFQGPISNGSHCDRFIPKVPQLKDIFIANALLMGELRTREIGSYYIQAFGKVFMRHAFEMDLESIVKKVDEIVYLHDRSTQHTYYNSINFTKKCYFNPPT